MFPVWLSTSSDSNHEKNTGTQTHPFSAPPDRYTSFSNCYLAILLSLLSLYLLISRSAAPPPRASHAPHAKLARGIRQAHPWWGDSGGARPIGGKDGWQTTAGLLMSEFPVAPIWERRLGRAGGLEITAGTQAGLQLWRDAAGV